MIIENVIVGAIIITLALIISLIPIFIGVSQKRKTVKPSELFPPRGASPIDVLLGYYGRLANPRKLFNPLMLYWAARGFITVEEDCKRGLKLTKLKEIEPPGDKDGFNPETYEIEKKFFNNIFYGRRKTFYTLAAGSYFTNYFNDVITECKKIAKDTTERKTKPFSTLLTILPFVLLFFVTLLVGLSTKDVVVIVMLFPAFAMLFSQLIHTADNAPEKGSSMSYFMAVFLITCGGIPFFATVYLLPWEAGLLLGSALIVALLILFVIRKRLDLRMPAQHKFYGQICGFKRFLLLAERAKLEALVEDDPEYFYEILPYCYVLGITKKLRKRFDRILLDGAGWYLGELRDKLKE